MKKRLFWDKGVCNLDYIVSSKDIFIYTLKRWKLGVFVAFLSSFFLSSIAVLKSNETEATVVIAWPVMPEVAWINLPLYARNVQRAGVAYNSVLLYEQGLSSCSVEDNADAVESLLVTCRSNSAALAREMAYRAVSLISIKLEDAYSAAISSHRDEKSKVLENIEFYESIIDNMNMMIGDINSLSGDVSVPANAIFVYARFLILVEIGNTRAKIIALREDLANLELITLGYKPLEIKELSLATSRPLWYMMVVTNFLSLTLGFFTSLVWGTLDTLRLARKG